MTTMCLATGTATSRATSAAPGLAGQLAARGFEPVGVEMPEFRKAGGGPKCCTLELR